MAEGFDTPIAVTLARYFADLRFEDLPSSVVAQAKALVRDQLACQLLGSTMPWTEPALRLIELGHGGRTESTIVNRGIRCLAADAAFLNATYGQACEMDESVHGAGGHIGAATVPVALAMGEREAIDGRQFLLAIICGYEIMYRLMAAITPHNIERGFHGQGIAGPYAGAVAAGKIMGLDADRLVHAIAIAGSHSCGPLEYDQSGGEVKRIHAGLGARGGVHAALLAQFGLTGPPTIIEGKRGFCNLFAAQARPMRIIEDLGSRFSLDAISFKMYPTVGALHTSIAAVTRLVREHGITAGNVAKVRVGVARGTLLHGASIREPHDVVSAQFSLAYSIALGIVFGSNDLQYYTDPRLWRDARMIAVMRRIDIHAHPEAVGDKAQMAEVAVELTDGRSVSTVEFHRKGSPQNPVTAGELDAKTRRLSASVLPAARVDRLLEEIDTLERAANMSRLAGLLVAH